MNTTEVNKHYVEEILRTQKLQKLAIWQNITIF